MTGQVKCPICEKLNSKEKAIKYKNRFYCPDCLEEHKQTSEKNKDGWNDLYNYLKELTNNNITGRMYKQLAEFRKEPYNYTNKGMQLTLYYFHELLGNPVREDTLGIIPYVYEEAKQEYIKNMEIHEHNSEMEFKEKIIKIQVNPTKSHNKKKLIDFSKLEDFE